MNALWDIRRSVFWKNIIKEPYYVGLFIHLFIFGVLLATAAITYLFNADVAVTVWVVLIIQALYFGMYKRLKSFKYKIDNKIPIVLNEKVEVHDKFTKEEENQRRSDPWYDAVVYVFHLFHYINFFSILVLLAYVQSMTLTLIFALAWGYAYSGILIAFSHEFLHRRSLFHQMLGGSLWSFFCYGTFLSEHCMVHHVHVATPLDASSAPKGQTLYQFLPRALMHNAPNGFKAEAKRLRERGKSPWSVYNRILWLSLLSVLIFAASYLIAGKYGVVFFLVQTVFSILKIEVANYFLHYGLERKLLENGRYERVSPLHSWNIEGYDHFTVINVSRHSDHHAFPRRPYPVLRNFPDAPQLPLNFSQALMLPYFPKIWFSIMDPVVDEHMKKLEQWRKENKDDYAMVMGIAGRSEMQQSGG
jgi:alkane 1-monooxygenase